MKSLPHLTTKLNEWHFIEPDKTRNFLEEEFEIKQINSKLYYKLSQFHYINTKLPAGIKKAFGLFHKKTGVIYGVIVYSAPSLNNECRKRTILGEILRQYKSPSDRFKKLNRLVCVISRVIIHPSLRGVGAASYIIEKTWRLAGTKYVEIVATMLYYGNFLPKTYRYYYKMEKVLEAGAFFPHRGEKAAMARRLKTPVMRYGYALFINT